MNVRRLASGTKRSLALSVGFAALAAGLYFVGVTPTAARLVRACEERDDLNRKLDLQNRDILSAEHLAQAIATLEKTLDSYRKAMLQPLLESNAMRVKFELDPLTLASGLKDVRYEALMPLALPPVDNPNQAKPDRKQTKKGKRNPKAVAMAVKPVLFPAQQHVRQPIRIVAKGSFQAAVSFLLRVEEAFPLVILQSLTVTAEHDPLRQRIELILEWPAPGKAACP